MSFRRWRSASSIFSTGMPVQRVTTLATSRTPTSSRSVEARASACGEPLFEVRDHRIGQFAGAAPIAAALRPLKLGARLIEFLLQLAALGAARLRGAPRLLHRGLLLLGLGQLGFELLQPLLRGAVGFGAQRLALDLELHDAPAQRIERLGLAVDRDAHARGGFVDQVDRLVGQTPVADIARAERYRRDDRRVGDAHAVMHLVAALQPAQDRHGVVGGRLVDRDRLKAPCRARRPFRYSGGIRRGWSRRCSATRRAPGPASACSRRRCRHRPGRRRPACAIRR